MIDKRPALIARCADVADVIAAVNFAREHKLLARHPRRRPQRPRPRHLRRRAGDRPLADERASASIRPRAPPASRAAAHWGDVRPRHARLRAGHSQSASSRPPASAGSRSAAASAPDAQVRPDDRQPARGRHGAGRRQLRHRQRRRSTPTCSGRCAAAAATSASSPRSCSSCTRQHRLRRADALADWTRSAEVMRWYRDFIPNAPDELNGFFAFLTVPPAAPFPEELWNQKMCGVVWCYTGRRRRSRRSRRSARSSARRRSTGSGRCRTRRCKACSTGSTRRAMQWYWKADFVNELPDEAIDLHVAVRRARCRPGTRRCTSTRSTAPPAGWRKDATAWNYRDANWAHGDRRGQSRSGRQRRT